MVTKKHNYFYKITNLVNGKYYYGIRSSNKEPLDDVYMGSGNAIKAAIKKYGIKNFAKEVIADYPTRKEASDHEKGVVTELLVNSVSCYNCRTGGDNEFSYKGKPVSDEQKKVQSLKMKGRVLSEEHKTKVSEALRGTKNPMYGKKHTEKSKSKNSESQRGAKSAWWGRKHTEEELNKMSVANAGANNAMAKKCMIEGVEYGTIKEAALSHKIIPETVRKRLNSKDSVWKNWRFLNEC